MNNVVLQKGPPEVHVVVVGDTYVGKTFLLKTYLTREYPKTYEKPSLERYFEDVTVDGQDFHIILWEPIALDNYDKLREFIYGKADCILICYAVNNYDSFERVPFWHAEAQKHCPEVPIILVATKIDLRDSSWTCVSRKEGKKLKSTLNAAGLVECSALMGTGLRNIFVQAIKSISKEEKCRVA